MMLIKNRCAVAHIVVAREATPTEWHAAEELGRFLRQMTGSDLAVSESRVENGPNVYIGSAWTGPGPELAALGFDGYVVETRGHDLILAGAKPYSCLYAVYHLLQRHLGCGFFEDGDQVPRRETVELGTIHDVCKPRFEHRQFIHPCHSSYSNRWWSLEDWKRWLDYGAKMRFNVANLYMHLAESGLAVLVWKRLGAGIELTDHQRAQMALYREVVRHARLLGIRVILPTSRAITSLGHIDRSMNAQFEAFHNLYKDKAAFIESLWCGWRVYRVSAADPLYTQAIGLLVEEAVRHFGTDHLYALEPVSEENLLIENPKERDALVQGMLRGTIKAVRGIDPQARFMTDTWCMVGEDMDEQRRLNAESQLKVIKEEDTIIQEADVVLCPIYLKKNYFYGKPWLAGIMTAGGGTTGLYGYLAAAIQALQQISRDPKASSCIGFASWPESHDHNHYYYNGLAELAWDPQQVWLGDYLRRHVVARFGPEHGLELLPAVHALNASVYNTMVPDALNRPFYRLLGWRWAGESDAQERQMATQEPDVLLALRHMLKHTAVFADSPLFRRDLVDVAKLYLGLRVNAYKRDLMTAVGTAQSACDDSKRQAARSAFEKSAAHVLAGMRAIAKMAGGIPHYRLRSEEDRAEKWPPIIPGEDNLRYIRERRTLLLDLPNWNSLLDYWGEDHQELIEYCYIPRVEARIDELRAGLGQAINQDRAEKVSQPTGLLMNFAPSTGHPADKRIVEEFVTKGYPRRKVRFYAGSLPRLIRSMLTEFPPTDDEGIV